MKTGVAAGMMQLQTKELQASLAVTGSYKRQGRFSPRAIGENTALLIP